MRRWPDRRLRSAAAANATVDALRQAIADRDSELEKLHRAVSHRDSELGTAYKAIGDRDNTISNALREAERLKALLRNAADADSGAVVGLPLLRHRRFVLSTPKAGTYLMASMLKAAGIRDAELHIDIDGLTDYRGLDVREKLASASSRYVQCPLEVSTSLIRDHCFAVGHIAHQERSVAALAPFSKVFLVREWRESLVSFMRFEERRIRLDPDRFPTAQTGWISDDSERKLLGFLDAFGEEHSSAALNMVGWLGDVHLTRFEDLSGRNGTAAQNSAARDSLRSLGCPLKETGVSEVVAIATSNESGSLTRSASITQLGDYWTEEAEQWFQAHRGPEVNSAYGY